MELETRDPATYVTHSRGESLGFVFDGLAGLASGIAALIILALIFRRLHKDSWSSCEALDISVIALFVAELIQGVGHSMDAKWIIEGRAYTGRYCTAQALLRQLGGACVALATLTIAVQTFLTIWWLKRLSRTISVFVIGFEFLFMILFVSIAFGLHTHPDKEFYAIPTPYWCWLGKAYKPERMGAEYVWYWTALFISLALYPPLFLLHRNIIKPGTHWYSPKADAPLRGEAHRDNRDANLRPENPADPHDSLAEERAFRDPQVLSRKDLHLWSTILYPTLYCVVVLPLSVIRWINFREEAATGKSHQRPAATLSSVSIFAIGGALNALLYPLTRAWIFRPDQKGEPHAPAIKTTPITGESSNQSTIRSTTQVVP